MGYRHMFEQRLDEVLGDLEMDKGELVGFCESLRDCDEDAEVAGSGGLQKKVFDPFIDALTSSEQYDVFLNVMFTEVRRQQLQAAGLAQPQAQEIEVGVPE